MGITKEQQIKLMEIAERLSKTTPGKWLVEGVPYNGHDEPSVVSDVKAGDGSDTYICQTVYDMQSCTEEHNVDDDTIFIANAKEDIAYLLSLIVNGVEGLLS